MQFSTAFSTQYAAFHPLLSSWSRQYDIHTSHTLCITQSHHTSLLLPSCSDAHSVHHTPHHTHVMISYPPFPLVLIKHTTSPSTHPLGCQLLVLDRLSNGDLVTLHSFILRTNFTPHAHFTLHTFAPCSDPPPHTHTQTLIHPILVCPGMLQCFISLTLLSLPHSQLTTHTPHPTPTTPTHLALQMLVLDRLSNGDLVTAYRLLRVIVASAHLSTPGADKEYAPFGFALTTIITVSHRPARAQPSVHTGPLLCRCCSSQRLETSNGCRHLEMTLVMQWDFETRIAKLKR